jgi:hypothetical protein
MISLPDMPDIPEMAAVYLAMEWAEQALAPQHTVQKPSSWVR